MLLKKIILFSFVIFSNLYANVLAISPSEVYAEVEKINRELFILDKHVKGNNDKNTFIQKQDYLNVNIQPRHVWQKCYQLMVMINVFRKKHGFPRVEEVNIEPVLHLEPKLVYEMTQRILTEIRIMKRQMGIVTKIVDPPVYKNKRPIDVFLFLDDITHKLDRLNGHQTVPSDVYAQAMRIFEEISLMLDELEITDTTTPFKKSVNAKPKDALKAVFRLLDGIQLLQKDLKMETTDFSSLQKNNVQPREVFNMIILTLAELQPIKASLHLNRIITPPARYFENKKPKDVEQLTLWNMERVKLIRSRLQKGMD